VLSQTIQATGNPKLVLSELLRIGRHAMSPSPISAIGRCARRS